MNQSELLATLTLALEAVEAGGPWLREGETEREADRCTGCTWDSGPYSIFCHHHDPLPHLRAAAEALTDNRPSPPESH